MVYLEILVKNYLTYFYDLFIHFLKIIYPFYNFISIVC